VTIALRDGFTSSMRRKCASVTSTGETVRALINAASSVADFVVISSNSVEAPLLSFREAPEEQDVISLLKEIRGQIGFVGL
jgi:hypothetical protein